MRIFKDANYPFLSWRRPAFIILIVALVVTVGGMVRNILDPEPSRSRSTIRPER